MLSSCGPHGRLFEGECDGMLMNGTSLLQLNRMQILGAVGLLHA